jgi:hypothetical protein
MTCGYTAKPCRSVLKLVASDTGSRVQCAGTATRHTDGPPAVHFVMQRATLKLLTTATHATHTAEVGAAVQQRNACFANMHLHNCH